MTALALVATDTYRAIGEAVALADRDAVPVAILGPTGTGKSEAIDQHAPSDTAYLAVPARSTRVQAIRTLLEGLTGARQDRGVSRDLLTLVREEIRGRSPLLVVDPVTDGQQPLLALLLELWEAGEPFGLVVAGDEQSNLVLHEVPGLRRTAAITHATPMAPAEVVECVPLLHEIYDHADLDLLLRLDAHYAYGYLARWHRLTVIAEHAAGDQSTLDQELADIALATALRSAP